VAEAVWAGCRPLLPRALVYPQLYPERCLYEPGRFVEGLAPLLTDPVQARQEAPSPGAYGETWSDLQAAWQKAFSGLLAG
jgi:hypothetical protein